MPFCKWFPGRRVKTLTVPPVVRLQSDAPGNTAIIAQRFSFKQLPAADFHWETPKRSYPLKKLRWSALSFRPFKC